MDNNAGIAVPTIEDADIAWVCELLGLPATAFSGPDGNDPRLRVIRSMDTVDVEACPGSGKTTLLVAKLAILGQKWTETRCGLCVMSHTNVARREIEARLGNTAAGQRLLGHPHFIGTIHAFVNEFLALPWLRSQGYPIEMIDDGVSLRRRWYKLSIATRRALEKNRYTEQRLRFMTVEFNLGEVKWGKGHLGPDTQTYQEMRRACEASAREGYFCHEEMFVWACDMIDKLPGIREWLRIRFPFVFIDEVQDNSELQSKLLHRIFIEGDNPVVRQRLGDANQAIYQFSSQTEDVVSDEFPIAEICTDLPNSFRFGQGIADLANPLAVEPQGLKGLKRTDIDVSHAIFLFDDASIDCVLERYAAYLLDVFSDDELQCGSFTAVGAVHRPGAGDNMPRSVGHYWTAYDYEIGMAEPHPKSFVQYVVAGLRLARMSGETHALVEKVADGVLRLVRLASPERKLGRRKRRHRYVLELLEEHAEAKANYLNLIRSLCVGRAPLTNAVWDENWRGTVAKLVRSIAGADGGGDAVDDFLTWNEAGNPAPDDDEHVRSDNVFRYPAANPAVAIRVGSIHGVKGETHMATLVLDTFYRSHHLKTLKAWLNGKKAGGAGESASTQSRLRLHYVAMSRPSHLLCLAMREDALTEADTIKAIDMGWRVGRVTDMRTEWKER